MLLAMVEGPTGTDMKDLVIELCLTILTFEPTISCLVPLDQHNYLAIATVIGMLSSSCVYVCQQFFFNLKGNIAGEEVTPGLLSTILMSSIDPSRRRIETLNMKVDIGQWD